MVSDFARWTIFPLTLALSGCATLLAPDEAKTLQSASDDFTTALRIADGQQDAALLDRKLGNYRLGVLNGTPVAFVTDCEKKMRKFDQDYEDAIGLPYDSVANDVAFRKLRSVVPCGIRDLQLPLSDLPLPKPVSFDQSLVASVGQSSLSAAARQLDAYTAALADIATGESSATVDSATAKVVTAGKGLLTTLKVGGPADAALDLAGQAINSIVAAKRNATTREFLDRMDPAMPFLMERLGVGARVAVMAAALNRAGAAADLAIYGNAALNGPNMVQWRGRVRTARPQRVALYDDLAARLETQNSAFRSLQRSDPMIAARAFAEAHHALREVYHDPRANRAVIATALAAFQTSTAALLDALKPKTT